MCCNIAHYHSNSGSACIVCVSCRYFYLPGRGFWQVRRFSASYDRSGDGHGACWTQSLHLLSAAVLSLRVLSHLGPDKDQMINTRCWTPVTELCGWVGPHGWDWPKCRPLMSYLLGPLGWYGLPVTGTCGRGYKLDCMLVYCRVCGSEWNRLMYLFFVSHLKNFNMYSSPSLIPYIPTPILSNHGVLTWVERWQRASSAFIIMSSWESAVDGLYREWLFKRGTIVYFIWTRQHRRGMGKY